ncbi:urease accessory protein [Caldimonas thermodepolymerans]|jgi:Urease accessory protein UreH|uniref:Urease accessory protein UreD n=2 Tax=Caldimonas thermodepolymerans TaxID=215580 RepID=A0AA46DCH1_9BURK|nr:urease accessory protein [Caldimonas thermodepolymerans]
MNGIPVLDRPARRYTGGLSTATAGPGAGTSPMSWHGRLELRYRHDPEGRRTVGHDRHDGPLRVLASLHPEGPGVCHHVLVHPPGGIVGGDVLEIDVEVQAGAHALITTPGATRFYRSAGPTARQHLRARVASGARLEWLPLETIAYDGVRAVNAMRFELDDGAEMIGWDLLALGLPAAGEPLRRGRFEQQIELPGAWLERGLLDMDDPLSARLLASPLGWDGRSTLATLWFASGSAMTPARRDALLAAAREAIEAADATLAAGATSPDGRVVVLRALARRTEPAFALLADAWARWRQAAWARPACPPRVWRT